MSQVEEALTSAFEGIRLVAFDLDGTLIDSVGDLCHCLGEALESAGLPRPSEAQTRSWIGGGVQLLIRRALHWALGKPGDSVFDSVYASFSACYGKNLFVRSRLYPCVPETLAALQSRGMQLCCITNKQTDFAEGVLEQAGILRCFELVLGGDSLPERKPSAMPLDSAARALGAPSSAAVLVGDSERDYEASQAAGWPFVWLTYGYPGDWKPPQKEAVAVLDRFADLLPLLSA